MASAATQLRELAEAADAVLVSKRPIRVGGKGRFNDPVYGPAVERLDKLVKAVLRGR